ncbi:hypothetical protein ACJX0J_008181 [Zea mays]
MLNNPDNRRFCICCDYYISNKKLGIVDVNFCSDLLYTCKSDIVQIQATIQLFLKMKMYMHLQILIKFILHFSHFYFARYEFLIFSQSNPSTSLGQGLMYVFPYNLDVKKHRSGVKWFFYLELQILENYLEN